MADLLNRKNITLFVIALMMLGAIGYLGYQDYLLTKSKKALESDLSKTQTEFAETKTNLEGTIGSLENERDALKGDLEAERARVDAFSAQLSQITGQIGILEKIHRTDPELLKKYSKVYFLNENYVPQKLITIDPKYVTGAKHEQYFQATVWPNLQNLLDNASSSGVDLKIISAYRSFDEQVDLKTSYKVVYGSGANSFSADQGYSEHQLGTALDFTTLKLGATFSTFDKTPGYEWLIQNAYKYGFILSYPKNNGYYVYEPWHWRFIGKALSQKLHDENKNFYDLDQREIDTYLVSFFD